MPVVEARAFHPAKFGGTHAGFFVLSLLFFMA